MGIILTDIVIESVLREGLKEFKQNPQYIDDLFSSLTEDHLIKDYGEKAINQIKEFVLNSKINIYQSYNFDNSKFPCCSINLIGAVESDRDAFLDDFDSYEEVEVAEELKFADAELESYDINTGFVSLSNDTDLSQVEIGSILIDSGDNAYPVIGSIINNPNNKKIYIGKNIDVSPIIDDNAYFINPALYANKNIKASPFREEVLISIFGINDPNMAKYIYYIIVYIIHKNRSSLMERGIELSSIRGSDFSNQAIPDTNEKIYSRYITLSCMTTFRWTQSTELLIQKLRLKLRVPKDKIVFDDDLLSINTEL